MGAPINPVRKLVRVKDQVLSRVEKQIAALPDRT
jgi:hypothetical protein